MVRYYPPSKVITNLSTSGAEYTLLDGSPYSGKYYTTFEGKYFSGPNPDVGPSEPLVKLPVYPSAVGFKNLPFNETAKESVAQSTGVVFNRISGKPNSYYPQPVESDYRKGYVIRYFTKKENERGFVVEISQEEYNNITNGTADYDVSIYQTTKILWKLTGPLNSQRKSQYNIIPGIIDTNKRLTEAANKTFLGIVEFIGGDYAKFARPTP